MTDTYIVRIYRRAKHEPQEIAGIAEHVEKEQEFRFQNLDELCGIIANQKSRTTKVKQRRTDNNPEESVK